MRDKEKHTQIKEPIRNREREGKTNINFEKTRVFYIPNDRNILIQLYKLLANVRILCTLAILSRVKLKLKQHATSKRIYSFVKLFLP